ncbi:BREX-1 system adenine-specific DNA-methyltransferase PglX [Desulfobacter sp.]|uniref:BREX-1 system adenine-specific DNA-methyltransferase PglX n=1 Tax=Desulfobacter sp. TaxID=2294 RepID=UPI000E8B3FF6|nr:BREX-1 system adenine-specific DNA-methyltransferase PglX [Desulfobacter sp.]HBT88577.1 BREX-1 system adenine-specific DNA-methyltransferase PglX [Desulfobacter sp.]
MDTTQIKAYAPQARKDFINAVTQRAARFGIHGDGNFDPVEFKGDTAIIGSQVFTKKGGELRERLVAKVKQTGFEMFIRSSAYTWFNRFVAIRYMELHDFLHHGFRVLSNPNGSDIPEILEHATEVDLPGLDREKVLELRLAGDKDNELYRMLVIAQCNALHKAMPFLFDRIDNEAELLLPDNLLHTNSPVKRMVSQIDETLWDDVEIIGWIYQFYISEKKDEVIGKVVKSEDIPAATQWFTPNWIVKYMVQNTLGRMWMATYPESSLKSKMEYYIEPAEQEPEVQAEIDATTPKELNPEELTFLDPACGSGHILVEAYDIFKEIYLERGYRTSDIPRLILSKNIYGLDIDDRAAQLACFAVLMRARMDDRRLFSRDDLALNIMSIFETKGLDKEKLLDAVSKRDGDKSVWDCINELVKIFAQAKTFGSLISIPGDLAKKLDVIKSILKFERIGNDDIFNYIADSELHKLKPIVKQAQILTKRYDCVVANPPYMGNKGMPIYLKDYVKCTYPSSKTDLFAIFIERNLNFAKKQALVGMVTMQSWMFLSSFKKLREKILDNCIIDSLAHLGARAFDSISGEVVSTTTFVLKNMQNKHFGGNYYRLVDGKSEAEKKSSLLKAITQKCELYYNATANGFNKIHSSPIAYWINDKTLEILETSKKLGEIADARMGLATGNNAKYVRLWFEPSINNIDFKNPDRKTAKMSSIRWFPYCKGGPYRKWYGNNEYIVDWFNDGAELQNTLHPSGKRVWAHNFNLDYIFKDSLTWSDITSGILSVRYNPVGFLFDGSGTCAFFKNENEKLATLGLLNTSFANELSKVLNPTMHFQTGDFCNMPFKDSIVKSSFISKVEDLIVIAKKDWDSFETSWEFQRLPLFSTGHHLRTIPISYKSVCEQEKRMTLQMQKIEEDMNSIFIKEYNLQNEFCPKIPIHEVTLNCNPVYRYGNGKSEEEYKNLQCIDFAKELISYATGCMMGRFSLDNPGLIYAQSDNIGFNPSKYKTFSADDDGIIPIMDMDWFEDDATKRFIEFIKTAWPGEHLDENLKFIADSLNPKTNESPKDTIRRYLSTTFFKDHMKMYKKRPIYWLFSSGKQKAFECLVYLHRYNESTLSRMRSNYVTPLQGNISARIEFLEHEKDAASTPSAQKKIQKQIDVLKKKQMELKTFDDELRHYADMKISLDLDDGVKVNYGKFGNLLAEKKAITG